MDYCFPFFTNSIVSISSENNYDLHRGICPIRQSDQKTADKMLIKPTGFCNEKMNNCQTQHLQEFRKKEKLLVF